MWYKKPFDTFFLSFFLRLTGFVIKSFVQAQLYLSIDDQSIQDGQRWLATNQQDNGCFASVGKLFHTAMKVSPRKERKIAGTCYASAKTWQANTDLSFYWHLSEDLGEEI